MAASWVVATMIVGLVGLSMGVAFEAVDDDQLTSALAANKYTLVLFYPDPCDVSGCETVNNNLKQIEKSVTIPDVQLVWIKNSAIAKKLGLASELRLVFYRDSLPILYDGTDLEAVAVVEWMDQNLDSHVTLLTDASFEHETQAATGATTGDWFVQFYTSECNDLLLTWEALAYRLKGRMNVASVDYAANPSLQSRFDISKCPTVYFFRHGKMYSYDLSLSDIGAYLSFVDGWYTNAPSKPVPREQTPFDALVEKVVAWLKKNQAGGSSFSLTSPVVFGSFLALGVVGLVLFCFYVKRDSAKRKPKKID